MPESTVTVVFRQAPSRSLQQVFDFITTADKINLDYEMKMLREFTYDSVLSICEKISAYYDNAEKRIREVEGLINESLNSEG